MNRSRTLVALIASFSLMCSGCCLVQARKDTGEAYILPVRQWTWYEWGCAVIIGCVVYVITRSAEADNQLLPRDPCMESNRFPGCS